MVTVIIRFQGTQGTLRRNAEVVGQTTDILAHLLTHFLLRDATERGVLREHADILDIVQLAEDAQLRELRDTCQEYETQIRIAGFQRTIEVTHHVAKLRQLFLLMHHVQQGSVVLIDQDNHLLTGLGVGTFNETFQTLVRINSALITSVYLLVTIQFPLQLTQKPILVHMLRRAHVEMKHRIPCPLLLQVLDGQALEQFLSPLKITMERRSKQRLPEAAGTAQEYITRRAVCHSVDQFRLIYIHIIPLSQFGECLYSYRI